MSWAFNMGTLAKRSELRKRLEIIIEKVSDPELRNSIIQTRDRYSKRIGELNKQDYTDEDRKQIQQEHARMEEFLRELEKRFEKVPDGAAAAKRILAKHVLYCEREEIAFREEINASQIGISYAEDYNAYRKKLNYFIDQVLIKQGIEKLMEVQYSKYLVEPKSHFSYNEVLQKVIAERPYSYRIVIKMDNIGQDGIVIETEEIDIKDFFKRNPEYLQQPYMLEAANEYISISLQRFIEESCWQFEFYNEYNHIWETSWRKFEIHNQRDFNYDFSEELSNPWSWPTLQKDGTWIDHFDEIIYPRMWFGLKDQGAADMWRLDGTDIGFWFKKDKGNQFIEFENSEQERSYHGYMPDMKAIRKSCPVAISAKDTTESIKEKIQKFFKKQYRVIKQIPEKYVLYCDYPGLEFKTEINASGIRYSYKDDYDGYRFSLEEHIINELLSSSPGVEKLMDAHYTEDDVSPQLNFDYSELTMAIQEERPHNENVKIYLDTVNKNGKTVRTQGIDIMDVFEWDPDYFQEGGMWDATDEYIIASQSKFLREGQWHFALTNDEGDYVIEDITKWTKPQEDGSWIDHEGVKLHPCIWYGFENVCEEDIRNKYGESPWILNEENLKFWLSVSPGLYFIEYSYDGHAGGASGAIPSMKEVRGKCPILLEENDTQESIDAKMQDFFAKQYLKQKKQ